MESAIPLGLLLAFDDDADWESPGAIREGQVSATPTCLAVPVLHSTDVVLEDDTDPEAPIPEALVEVVLTVRALSEPADFTGTLWCRRATSR